MGLRLGAAVHTSVTRPFARLDSTDGCKEKGEKKEAAVGFEPTNNGFANRRLRPLGYAACETRVVYTTFAHIAARRNCVNGRYDYLQAPSDLGKVLDGHPPRNGQGPISTIAQPIAFGM